MLQAHLLMGEKSLLQGAFKRAPRIMFKIGKINKLIRSVFPLFFYIYILLMNGIWEKEGWFHHFRIKQKASWGTTDIGLIGLEPYSDTMNIPGGGGGGG